MSVKNNPFFRLVKEFPVSFFMSKLILTLFQFISLLWFSSTVRLALLTICELMFWLKSSFLFFIRAFCFSFLVGQERISLTQEEAISVPRSTFFSVVILVLVNHSCSSTCITWFLEASIHPGKAQVQLVLLHMWWRIQKLDNWFFRQVL